VVAVSVVLFDRKTWKARGPVTPISVEAVPSLS